MPRTQLWPMILTLFSILCVTLLQGSKTEPEDICNYETFQAKCLKNEVILMRSATFGRMRIGRCITAGEISALQRANLEDTKSYLGCSADVLPILDRKCSGYKDCEVRLSDISAEDIMPCLPGLVVYLEVSYGCISVVDEERSCTVSISNNIPTHIIGSTAAQGICGTESQPWHIEAPVGQRINVVLLNFASAPTPQIGSDHGEQPCRRYGTIVDKTGKRNTTICGDAIQREMKIYSSTGNSIKILFKPDQLQNNYVAKFIVELEAMGCSDIIPPEDAWLKRNKDAILIGCYSSRQTWHLNCQDGKWIGVVGNCSHDGHDAAEFGPRDAEAKSEIESKFSGTELVLAIVAILGFTVAICIAVICIGAICLRRVNKKSKTREEYKTLNCQINTVRSQQLQSDLRVSLNADGNEWRGSDDQQMSFHSVYDGDSEFNVVAHTPRVNGGNQSFQL